MFRRRMPPVTQIHQRHMEIPTIMRLWSPIIPCWISHEVNRMPMGLWLCSVVFYLLSVFLYLLGSHLSLSVFFLVHLYRLTYIALFTSVCLRFRSTQWRAPCDVM
ncbi:hypothetical protein JB92DRAFT_2080694 [Gautieria morchelliformis]|nr:hypothetical protein JB92DRAFT_2080694 [Gautieria morchelliformis]